MSLLIIAARAHELPPPGERTMAPELCYRGPGMIGLELGQSGRIRRGASDRAAQQVVNVKIPALPRMVPPVF